jgi:maltose/moltooligosaccharide transporter
MTTLTTANKPRLNGWQIFNMTFGFLGIQFGWALQMNNMSAIYEYLGANASNIPLLFLAAPLTGLIVQPIIGYLSDRTWHKTLGRRRPYFLIGAILSTIALIFMPNSPSLWIAAGLLWILDTSINITMEPFRAFVTDKLPDVQRTRGFAMQSLFIGLGSIIASLLPWMMTTWFHVSTIVAKGEIPASVRYSFYIGAVAFIIAVLYTIITSGEYPPADINERQKKKEEKKGFGAGAGEIFHAIANMPKRMRKLALMQFFTWPGLFFMWFYYTPAVARNVFGATSVSDPLYQHGVEFAGKTLASYNGVAFVFAFFIPFIAAKLGRKYTHMLCLLCGAAGLISVAFIHSPNMLYASMIGVGVAWASILSMPYAMLGGCLPEDKVGIYMGIFNFFIVLPEILASLFFGWIMSHLLHDNRLLAVEIGGCLMIIAALLALLVNENE